jgi:hypothetical protein
LRALAGGSFLFLEKRTQAGGGPGGARGGCFVLGVRILLIFSPLLRRGVVGWDATC